MASPLTLTLTIPDIGSVVRDGEDVRAWIRSDLGEVIAARLEALKNLNADLQTATARAAVIVPAVDLRGVGVTMGAVAD